MAIDSSTGCGGSAHTVSVPRRPGRWHLAAPDLGSRCSVNQTSVAPAVEITDLNGLGTPRIDRRTRTGEAPDCALASAAFASLDPGATTSIQTARHLLHAPSSFVLQPRKSQRTGHPHGVGPARAPSHAAAGPSIQSLLEMADEYGVDCSSRQNNPGHLDHFGELPAGAQTAAVGQLQPAKSRPMLGAVTSTPRHPSITSRISSARASS